MRGAQGSCSGSDLFAQAEMWQSQRMAGKRQGLHSHTKHLTARHKVNDLAALLYQELSKCHLFLCQAFSVPQKQKWVFCCLVPPAQWGDHKVRLWLGQGLPVPPRCAPAPREGLNSPAGNVRSAALSTAAQSASLAPGLSCRG